MTSRVFLVAAWAGLGVSTIAAAQEPAPRKPAEAPDATATDSASSSASVDEKPARPRIEKATFAGGCFWSLETVFERVRGVKSVVSGFAGGTVINPSYEMVGTGATGHAESIQIVYDASVVSYDDLLRLFFHAHDPTTLNAQGDDFGTQYRSMIFHHNESQRQAALKLYRELTSRKAFRNPIVTELVTFRAFWPAEPYHQDYYANHRGNFYCEVYIEPKLKKLRLTAPSKPTRRAKPAAGSAERKAKSAPH